MAPSPVVTEWDATVQQLKVEEGTSANLRWNNSDSDPAIPRKWYLSNREATAQGLRLTQRDIQARVKPGVESVGQVASIRGNFTTSDGVVRIGIENEKSAQKPVFAFDSKLPVQLYSLSNDWIDLEIAFAFTAEDAALFRGSSYSVEFDVSQFATQVSDVTSHQMVGGKWQRILRASARAFCKNVIPPQARLVVKVKPSLDFDWRNEAPYIAVTLVTTYIATYVALAPAAATVSKEDNDYELVEIC